MRSLLLGAADKVRVKVPGVDHDSACARIGDQNGDLLVIRFRLGERVVQNDVDGVLDSLFESSSATTTRSRYWSNMLATPISTTS